jgi:hypothetical protein
MARAFLCRLERRFNHLNVAASSYTIVLDHCCPSVAWAGPKQNVFRIAGR